MTLNNISYNKDTFIDKSVDYYDDLEYYSSRMWLCRELNFYIQRDKYKFNIITSGYIAARTLARHSIFTKELTFSDIIRHNTIRTLYERSSK